MKKRAVALLTAGVLLLAACGNEEGPSRGNYEEESGDVVATPTEVAEAEPTEAPTEAPTPTEEPEPEKPDPVRPLQVALYSDYDGYYDVDKELNMVAVRCPVVWLEEDDMPELQKALEGFNEDKKSRRDSALEDLKESALSMYDDGFWWDDLQFYANWDAYFCRADSRVVSIVSCWDEYSGGAHPMYSYGGYNYDSATGKALTVYDVIVPEKIADLPQLLEDKLIEKYGEDEFYSDTDISQAVDDNLGMNGDLPFTLGPEGMSFYFQPYELAPYVAGAQIITLGYDEYADWINPLYSETLSDYFIDLNVPGDVHIPGTEDRVFYYTQDKDEDGMEKDLNIVISDGESDKAVLTDGPMYCYETDGYLLHYKGKNYLYFSMLAEDDYEFLRVYEITEDENILFVDEISPELSHAVPTDPENLRMYVRNDVLSTMTAYATFHIGSDGLPVTDEDMYTIESSFEFTALQDFEITDPDGNSFSIKTGDKLIPVRTDTENLIELQTEDGTVIRTIVDREWPQTINGVDINELFDGIMFAG
ncbi:MAG: DUF3298 domain-containing protein [Lachnospiraceae bacterium]|nr:DUF3298 domain-containing protein [Lachnospiraceae bacterium]